jgi:hypothetical protein
MFFQRGEREGSLVFRLGYFWIPRRSRRGGKEGIMVCGLGLLGLFRYYLVLHPSQ